MVTILLAICCWDIPLCRPCIGLTYGGYPQFRFLKWRQGPSLKKHHATWQKADEHMNNYESFNFGDTGKPGYLLTSFESLTRSLYPFNTQKLKCHWTGYSDTRLLGIFDRS